MEYVSAGDEKIPITIVHSAKRKTIGLTVKETGEVILRVPKNVKEADALAFAESKADWIVKHRTRFLVRETPLRHYQNGDSIPFCGRLLTIHRELGNVVRAELIEDHLKITALEDTDEETIRDAVIFLYRRAALPEIRELVEEISAAAQVEAPLLRIRKQEKKWGCCTPKNGIILNVRILLAPAIVIRYLVVHEVAHLKHRNHQAGFWAEVERIMPEFFEAEKLLKTEGWQWVF